MIECTGKLAPKDGSELMCYRCGRGATPLWVMVEDGNADDEQYICTACKAEVDQGAPLGHLEIAVPPKETVN